MMKQQQRLQDAYNRAMSPDVIAADQQQYDLQNPDTILSWLRANSDITNPVEGTSSSSWWNALRDLSPTSPTAWGSIKAMAQGRDPFSVMPGGPSMWDDLRGTDLYQYAANDIQGAYNKLASMFGQQREPAAVLWPSQHQGQPTQSMPSPTGQAGGVSHAINWMTPAPQITNPSMMKEKAADQWSQGRPGVPLTGYNPYADDPLARYR